MTRYACVHVPRTGGTSIRAALVSAAWGRLKSDYYLDLEEHTHPFRTDTDKWIKENKVDLSTEPDGTIVYGHFPASKYLSGENDGVKGLIWLRDPVERIASSYLNWTAMGDRAVIFPHIKGKGASFLEFAKQPGISNLLTEVYLKGVNLDRFSFIGCFDRYKEDFKVFSSLLQLPASTPITAHTFKRGAKEFLETVSAEDIRIVEKLNSKDIELYSTFMETSQ